MAYEMIPIDELDESEQMVIHALKLVGMSRRSRACGAVENAERELQAARACAARTSGLLSPHSISAVPFVRLERFPDARDRSGH